MLEWPGQEFYSLSSLPLVSTADCNQNSAERFSRAPEPFLLYIGVFAQLHISIEKAPKSTLDLDTLLISTITIVLALALTLSSYIILGDFRKSGPATPKVIARKLLNAFSDQQIIEVSIPTMDKLRLGTAEC